MNRCAALLGALALVACADPVRTVGPELLNQTASNVDGETRYVVVFHQQDGLPSKLADMLADAGGTLASAAPEIGAIQVLSSDPNFSARMAKNPQVSDVGIDADVQLIPSGEDPSSSSALLEAILAAEGSGGPAEPAGPDPQPGTEPLYNQQWDKMRINASNSGSYNVQRGRKEVVVGILDTGAEVLPVAHPDIAPNLDFARSRSFVFPAPPGGDPNPARWDDRNGHGSWCASAVAAPINKFGISGVAPNVTLVALKVLNDGGSGSFFGVAQALVYAGVNKFDVASMSLGAYVPHSGGGQTIIKVVQRAINFARSNGVTPLGALGNDNFDISDGSFVRDFIFIPAELPGVIGVSSTAYDNRKAFYSNYGVGKTDVSAPGGGSTTFNPMPPNYFGFGRVLGAWATESIGTFRPVLRREQCTPGPGGACSYYAWVRGTSMATPNAAGVAALIISQYGDFTPDNSRKGHMSPQRVESILQETANNQPCVDNDFPDIFNLDAQCSGGAGGYTSFFGKGIVDALKAVTQ
ncbi:MAG TPA: S8 family serine peptidase [Gemmatimonadaceae bacterium]|nr:S8 family serine peptidase [Gemmatimonadaceae bacterium]